MFGPIKVWLLVLVGTLNPTDVVGTGAGVSNHMFYSYNDCMTVAQELDRVHAKCKYVTVVVNKGK